MAEYLNRFFDLWSYDAQIVSKLLGYSDDFELWDEGKIAEKTTILARMKEEMNSESSDMSYSEDDMSEVAPLIKSLAQASNYKISDLDEILKKANGEAPVSEQEEAVEKASNTSPNEEVNMTTENVEMIEKSAVDVEIAKAVAAKEAELLEIQKGLQDQLAEFNKAKEEAEKAQFIEKAKGFEVAGIEGEAVEGFALALQKASKDADLAVLVQALEKMVTLTKSIETVSQSEGHAADLSDTGVSVSDILKAKKTK